MTARPLAPLDAWASGAVMASVPLRILLATSTDLSPDEAYYLAASRFGLTIRDHPALVVWLAGFGDALPWLSLELRVRLPVVVIATITSLASVELVRRRGAIANQQRWAAALTSWLALPLAGGFVATPDAPLACAVVMVALLRQLDRERGWVLLGAAAWLGTMAKVIMIPIAAVACFTPRRWRSILSITAGVLLTIPWILPSLSMQLGHAFAPGAADLLSRATAVVALVAAQLALWTPVVVILGFASAMRRPFDREVVITITGLVLISALATGTPPEPNWWAPAGLLVAVGASMRITECRPAARAATLLLGPALALVVATHTAWPWIPIPRPMDPTARLHGWRSADPPLSAPGVGAYGPSAEQCVYQGFCETFNNKFKFIDNNP